MNRPDVAVVVIGRNEGARLARCLQSVRGQRVIYVDSGSSDGSVDRARATGAEVIELDPASGFSAARGRNAGLERLSEDPAVTYIQLVDGDCVLDPAWIERGAAALDAHPGAGAVVGTLRESEPDGSIYAWMCDVEWTSATGAGELFGGIVLLRADAARHVGRFSPDMIAGEDFDFALRLRAAGWRIRAIAEPMATHDSDLRHFGQWWRRTIRGGYAFGELTARHGGSRARFARNRRRILFWAGLIPIAAAVGLALAAIAGRAWLLLSAAALLLTLAQIARVWWRAGRRHPPLRAFLFALFLAIGKYAELIGLLRFELARRNGRRARPIEYKR